MNINTIEVAEKLLFESDTVSALEEALREVGIDGAKAFSTSLYTLAGKIDKTNLPETTKLVHHNITQDVFVNERLATKKEWEFAIRIDFKPGVTDNAARVLKKDLGLIDQGQLDVYTSNIHYIHGLFNPKLQDQLERVASNPQIHDISILTKQEFEKQNGFKNKINPVILSKKPNFFYVDLGSMNHDDLILTGELGTLNTNLEQNPKKKRGGELSLEEDYMYEIKNYSLSEKNNIPGRKKGTLTDTELEVFAQMWSEHCRHSLYNAAIPENKNGIFEEYIKNPTLEVLKEKPHLGVSIYKDNSGVFKFNDKWLICIKNETHNSPSALDPYGGAITGIVGVNRDPAGTGIGAEVIGNFLFYFLGHPEDKRKYFKNLVDVAKKEAETGDKYEMGSGGLCVSKKEGILALENLLLNPKQIFDGVVTGVEEGGNQMGIAINLGICNYNNNYNGKPIVGVGSVGRMPAQIGELLTHKKYIEVGDRLYVIGGRAGIDGIHGATFSSKGLTSTSPATAVQIGDPYTQRKMFEALLELRDLGYIKFITDLGAGGISCAALEMAEETNGLDIDLDKLLQKYQGMTATELFLNESQERMAIAVNEENKDEIEAVLKKHEVEFSDIGMFTDSGRAIVKAKGDEVVNLDMDFLHNGFPSRSLKPAEYRQSKDENRSQWRLFNDASETLRSTLDFETFINVEFYKMINRPNFRSVAPFMDRMDSTVKGLSVQHCIQGKGRVSTSASCTLPDIDSKEGLIQAYGHSERQSYIDSEKMGKNAFLRSIGNNIAMGGRLDYMVATDQALWQSSDDPKYQQMLIEANKGMGSVISGCKIPVISGKDSMYNQAKTYDEQGNVVKRGVFPTILMTTFSKIDNVEDLVTIDAKKVGDLVYVVGSTTKADLGGSEYMNMYSEDNERELNIGQVSDENIDYVYDTFEKMNIASKKRLLQSAKYVEAGGLAIALKDTATAGELGIEVSLDDLHRENNLDITDIMFGETEGRFLVTIKQENKKRFERIFADKYSRIGVVKSDDLVMNYKNKKVLDNKIASILNQYHKAA